MLGLVRRWGAPVPVGATILLAAIVAVGAGCTVLTGASDLHTADLATDVDAGVLAADVTPPPPEEDAGRSASDAGADAAPDAAPPPLPPGRLRQFTFERGVVRGDEGADEASGFVTLVQGTSALSGKYSVATRGPGTVSAVVPAQSDAMLTFLVVPIVPPGGGETIVAHVGASDGFDVGLSATDQTVAAFFDFGGGIRLTSEGIAKAARYRIRAHLVAGDAGRFELSFAADGVPFGDPSSLGTKISPVTRFDVGFVKAKGFDVVVDDIFVDVPLKPQPANGN